MSSLGHSIWTVIVFIIFIGIVLWAYSGNRKKDFDEAANLALDDDDIQKPAQHKTEE
jgi:cytochrome c oxidase cbb3-type subunit IV